MGKPIKRSEAEKWIVQLFFASRFLEDPHLYCNAAFATIKIKPSTRTEMVVVGKEALTYAKEVLQSLGNGEVAPLTRNPVFASRSVLGVNCDAIGAEEEGIWGANVCQYLCKGVWHIEVTIAVREDEISISTLELQSCQAEALLAGHTRLQARTAGPHTQPNKTGAVRAAYSCIANSTPMCAALEAFKEHKFLVAHISGDKNAISGALSRGKDA